MEFNCILDSCSELVGQSFKREKEERITSLTSRRPKREMPVFALSQALKDRSLFVAIFESCRGLGQV